jgi:hypothetical protein
MRLLQTIFAFVASPLVGAIAGGIAVALVTPGPTAMLGVMFTVIGGAVAVAAALIFGLPTVLLARHASAHRLPWLLAVSVPVGLLMALLVQCAISACAVGPAQNHLFGVITGVTTALVLHALLPRDHAL